MIKSSRRFLLLSALSVLLSATSCQSQNGSNVLSPEEFKTQMEQTDNEILLDVRTPQEYANGYIDGAKNIDWNGGSFEQQVAKLDKTKPVYVYCHAGGRSAAAAKKLKSLGFKEVYDLDGGYSNWKRTMSKKSSGNLKGMTEKDFETLLETDKLVLVDFYADWCKPCKMLEPNLMAIGEENANTVKVVRINADDNEQLSANLSITALPTILFYKNGQLTNRHLGYVGKDGLQEMVNNSLAN